MADGNRFTGLSFPVVFALAAFGVFAVSNPTDADLVGRLGYAALLGGVGLATMLVLTYLADDSN